MSISYGFFNSVNGDRKYNAAHFGHCFDGIIRSGILASIGECFVVKASEGMSVNVGSGKAWYLSSWIENDADLPLIFEPADVVLNRIDTVVMEFNNSQDIRRNDIKIITGIASSTPTPSVLRNETAVVQVPLANIAIRANSVSITQSDITNLIGTDSCPFVTGLLDVISIDRLLGQWQSDLDRFRDNEQQDFLTWFETIRNRLSEDAAGNLENSKENRKLIFRDVHVAPSDFVEDGADEDYPYAVVIELDGATESMIPDVSLALVDIKSGYISPVAESYDGGIQLRASDIPEDDIVIPTIILWRGEL